MNKYRKVIQRIAAANSTSEKEVLTEMQKVIDLAFHNPDPAIQKRWRMVPHKKDRPTVEEFLDFTSSLTMNSASEYSFIHD